MRWIICVLMMVAAPAFATPEYYLPTLFDVIGVADDDVLNIRAAPDADAEIIGTLAPDATQIEVVKESNGWSQINTDERSGWVHSLYLNDRKDVWEPGKLPAGFSCYGTEPFWSIQPEVNAMVLSTPEVERDVRAIQAIIDAGAFHYPMQAVAAKDMTMTITPQSCSDGMSDRVYGLATYVILLGKQPQMLLGCCSIAP